MTSPPFRVPVPDNTPLTVPLLGLRDAIPAIALKEDDMETQSDAAVGGTVSASGTASVRRVPVEEDPIERIAEGTGRGRCV